MRSQHDPAVAASNVTLNFEGVPIQASEGETVATALLASGEKVTGTRAVSGRARGPYCLIGICHECLVEIDDNSNRRACLTTVRQDMRVRRQTALRRLMTGNRTNGP